MPFKPKPPDIDAVALRELDQLGVEAAKIQFMSYGTGGNVSVGKSIIHQTPAAPHTPQDNFQSSGKA